MSTLESQASPVKYPKPLRLAHWTAFALFVMLFVSGPIMVDLDKTDPFRRELMHWHKSVGVVALLVLLVRLFFRLRSQLPEFPASLQTWELKLAHWGHHFIYFFMIVIPLSGWADSDLHGRPVRLFGLALPKIFPTVEGLGGTPGYIHTVLSYILLGLIALHVLAVIKHRQLDKVNVLERIV